MTKVEIIEANLKDDSNSSIKKNKKNVCAYARVSTDNDDQQSSYSSQIKFYTEKIQSNPTWKFVGIYADEGISGTQIKNRTEFQRMIDDALDGKIDLIISKSISRFARNTLDTLKYVRLLREHNVDVFFEKENLHTMELESEMFLTFYSAFAQAESESTSQNVKMGLRAKFKRGEFTGRQGCYGYNWNKETKTLEINPEEAEVVKRIFNLYLSGKGTSAIAKILNSDGIKTHSGYKWDNANVGFIIKNEKYKGDLCSQKTFVDSPITHRRIRNFGEKPKYYAHDTHEPIISKEDWEKANDIMKSRSHKSIPNGHEHGKTGYSMMYPFSSKIVCAFCGNYYIRRLGAKRNDGTKNVYWGCSSKVHDSKDCKCTSFLRDEMLCNLFIEVYNTLVKNKHKTKEKLLTAIKNVLSDNDYSKEISKLEAEEKTLRNRLSNLIDMKLDDCISKDDYLEKEQELKDKIENVLSKKDEYTQLTRDNKDLSKKFKEISNLIEEEKYLDDFDRESFNSIIEKIVVGEVDENGNKNPLVIRFILKTGVEYLATLESINNLSGKTMSFSSVKS